MTSRSFRADERGLSRLMGYMLTLGIAMLMITGLFLSGHALVERQTDATVQSQMEVVGQHLAGSLEQTDRLVRSTESNPGAIGVSQPLPETLAKTDYTIEITSDEIILREAGGGITVRVNFRTNRDVAPTTLQGGPLVITYDTSSDELVANHE